MKKKYIVVLILFLIFPLYVDADSIALSCPNAVKNNQEFVCNLYGNSSSNINLVNAKLAITGDISYLSFSFDDSWHGDVTDGVINLVSSADKTGTFKIGVIKLNSSNLGEGIVLVDSIKFSNDNEYQGNVDSLSKKITVSDTASDEFLDDMYIANISIGNYNFNFDVSILEYTINIADENTLVIDTALMSDVDDVYVNIRGNENLVNGSVIYIDVLSLDNNEVIQTYKINIIKDDVVESVEPIPKRDYKIYFIVAVVVLIVINVVRIIISLLYKKEPFIYLKVVLFVLLRVLTDEN